jgi:hypothetical protein
MAARICESSLLLFVWLLVHFLSSSVPHRLPADRQGWVLRAMPV